jgi:hypothetical protein
VQAYPVAWFTNPLFSGLPGRARVTKATQLMLVLLSGDCIPLGQQAHLSMAGILSVSSEGGMCLGLSACQESQKF